MSDFGGTQWRREMAKEIFEEILDWQDMPPWVFGLEEKLEFINKTASALRQAYNQAIEDVAVSIEAIVPMPSPIEIVRAIRNLRKREEE